jgi:hypothetical protein
MTDPTALAEFRSIFGDEQNNYGDALQNYYKKKCSK